MNFFLDYVFGIDPQSREVFVGPETEGSTVVLLQRWTWTPLRGFVAWLAVKVNLCPPPSFLSQPRNN
jgi:hypothetical protein